MRTPSNRRAIPLLLALLLCAASSGNALARVEPAMSARRIPGTHVFIVVPRGFHRARRFAGWAHEHPPAAISAREIGVPVAAALSGFSAANLARRGMRMLGVQRVRVSAGPGWLYSLVRSTPGARPVRYWVLVFGRGDRSVLVQASYALRDTRRFASLLEQTLLGARYRARVRLRAQEGLAFRIRPSSDLRIARRLGDLLLLADPARGAHPSPGAPLLVIGEAPFGARVRDLREFARHRLAQMNAVTHLHSLRGASIRVAASPAYELTARGRTRASGVPVDVYQLLIPRTSGYLLVQGIAARRLWARYLPQFRKIARSVRFVR